MVSTLLKACLHILNWSTDWAKRLKHNYVSHKTVNSTNILPPGTLVKGSEIERNQCKLKQLHCSRRKGMIDQVQKLWAAKSLWWFNRTRQKRLHDQRSTTEIWRNILTTNCWKWLSASLKFEKLKVPIYKHTNSLTSVCPTNNTV